MDFNVELTGIGKVEKITELDGLSWPITSPLQFAGEGRVSEVVEIVWRRNLRVNQHPPNRRRQPPGRSRHEAEYR
jgi:hypothetical protein